MFTLSNVIHNSINIKFIPHSIAFNEVSHYLAAKYFPTFYSYAYRWIGYCFVDFYGLVHTLRYLTYMKRKNGCVSISKWITFFFSFISFSILTSVPTNALYTMFRNRRAMSMRLNIFHFFLEFIHLKWFSKCFLVNIVDHFVVQLRIFFYR